jgi:Tol biopolymer transport system component
MPLKLRLSLAALCLSALPLALSAQSPVGIFTNHADVGSVTPAGTASYDKASDTYRVSAAGENVWGMTDAFHFVWKKASGDLSLTADIDFPDKSGTPNEHRKAVLMLRQSLDANGVYADVAQHGNGLLGLQYRRTPGTNTQDIELNGGLGGPAPTSMRLEKRGDTITMFVATQDRPLHQVGASIKMHFDGEFYAGIGVCSHNKAVTETATFKHLALTPLTTPATPTKLVLYSTLQTIGIQDSFRRALVAVTTKGRMEAPNWSRDGKTLIFDQGGLMYKVPAEGGTPEKIDIGGTTGCTGSHGLSPDGKQLVITCATPGQPGHRVSILPASGGTPRIVTEHPFSYFHSWSPDGKTIVFVRPDHGGSNFAAISVDGGPEKLLTNDTGVTDDPDYSPDGKYIYFNSDRGGSMQIWRCLADGSQPEQMTHDDRHNWTPHPSPDGKSVVYISYPPGTKGHPANKDIQLRILTPEDGKTRVLVDAVGGDGTMNVNSWAPDGQHFAFVSYQMLPEDDNGSSE